MWEAKKSYLKKETRERIIFLIDMNSYFATCEQMFNPDLRGKPIGVGGSSLERTVVTAASYEAKRYGVKNGMSVYEAKKLCPNLILVPGDYKKYTETTANFLKIFQDYTPDLEVFSIDEGFLDVTDTEARFGGSVQIAKEIKKRIKEELGFLFTCSIGISYNKTMAKLAASKMKPDGLVWIKRNVLDEDKKWFYHQLNGTKGKLFSTQEALKTSRLTDLCGIGSRIERQLLNRGIHSITGLAKMPITQLKKKFGVYGNFLHLIANGEDPSPVIPYWENDSYKNMGHHYTLPNDLHTPEELKPLLLKFSEKIGTKLRTHGYWGKTIHLLLKTKDFSTLSQQRTLPCYTNDGYEIYKEACRILEQWAFPESVRMIGIQCSQLVKNYGQLSFLKPTIKQEKLIHVMDKINEKYGEFTVMRGLILNTKLKTHVGGFVEDKGKMRKNLLLS